MRHSKLMPEVNAGSMADIAFLLLIFFLVTATISSDEGISRVLPEACPPGVDCTSPINERNILRIVINNNDEIMVENELVSIEALKDITKNFIDNNGDGTCTYCAGDKSINASKNPKEAVVSLQNGQQTSYKKYVNVQNELAKAYYELRNTYSEQIIKKTSDKLTIEELKNVRDAYPFTLIEAETK
ncbi:biopolymer transport protein ExbD [Mariniflexile fucanivorans]|uniref:Biopolymer transport protein ExbD n=1 Tax=Mariniflexile fucanivorans TaxID=264023 RepID=A0A4R1RG14_9FLAO|nr:biopolymer transporter ExbD [Mariniflexile fucanivorans]TCL64903.1 biopolymer transport protein ExbD [Mariniflexile fucanivorans]